MCFVSWLVKFTRTIFQLRVDLTLSFNNGRLVEDVSFHPCVRFKRWEVSIFSCVIIVKLYIIILYWKDDRNGGTISANCYKGNI